MQLIFIVALGTILGFTYGSYTDGFIFSTNICLFAGITMIMPSLFKFKLKDIQLVWQYKKVLIKGIFVNYTLLPLFAMGIGFTTGDFGITAGLFLLSVLSGGGMIMHWIKKSNGDTSFGFLFLFINLVLVSLSLYMLHIFAMYSAPHFGISYEADISISRFSQEVVTLLILIPFIASRVVLFIKPLVTAIEKYSKYISHLSIFIILFYLFGLQSSQLLVEVFDFEPELFPISFVAVALFYLATTLLSTWIYDLNSAQERAAYWHTITRYITLGLVISTFSSATFGVSMLLPIMFAYIVQIPLSVYLSKQHIKHTLN